MEIYIEKMKAKHVIGPQDPDEGIPSWSDFLHNSSSVTLDSESK
jgi:hypothetical protein